MNTITTTFPRTNTNKSRLGCAAWGDAVRIAAGNFMGMRRKGRELAVQGLYEMEIRGVEPDGLEHFWLHAVADPETKAFGRGLLEGAAADFPRIDQWIEEAAANWRVERLSPVDRSVLRLATYELLHRSDVPTEVAINEAIEIARRFSTGESAAFVNGVLDQIAKRKQADA